MISGSDITLLVSGSIAAYKSAELLRELVKAGAKVQVGMTKAATEFVTPLTLQTLSGSPVAYDLFDAESELRMGHIRLADFGDVVLVAPATANCIARAAFGAADDVVTSTLLAAKAPVLYAPAMNVNMWENPITQENIARLKARGAHFVEPDDGFLACGWSGQGRLASIPAILHWVDYLTSPKDLTGSHVVVAAGPTREPLDPVRYISNRSSGKLGYALAAAAQLRGAHVSLVSGPTTLTPPPGVDVYRVETAIEMHDTILDLARRGVSQLDESGAATTTGDRRRTQFVFMVAAVADFRPSSYSATKRKHGGNGERFNQEFVHNPDILLSLGEQRKAIEELSRCRLKLIGFSAETGEADEMLGLARDKLDKKLADMVVANIAEYSFGKDTTRVWLLDRNGREEEISTADKRLVAAKLITAALQL